MPPRPFGIPPRRALYERPRATADLDVNFIEREAFIRNKKTTGRARDLGDIEGL